MSTQERMKILEMIAAGQISAEEAARLLDAGAASENAGAASENAGAASENAGAVSENAGAASENAGAAPEKVPGEVMREKLSKVDSSRMKGRRLRVKIVETSGTKVNVNLPLSLMEVGLKIGGRFVDELQDMDAEMQMLMEAIQNDMHGKIVEIDDEDSHVEIYIE